MMTGKDEERQKRLADALRENLRRRKAQARGPSIPVQERREKDSYEPG